MSKTSSPDTQFKLRILQSSKIFNECGENDLAELARCSQLKAFPGGKPLAGAGRDGETIFLVQSGVAAELQPVTDAGKSVLTELFGAGDAAGVVNAIANQEIKDRAQLRQTQSLTPVSALLIPSADFFRISRRSPELVTAIMKNLANRSLALGKRLGEAAHATLEARLAGLFSRIADLSTDDDWNPTVSIGHISQTGIAEMLGVSREHVNRTLSMWERSGLIFQNQAGEIVVQNRKRLAVISRDQRQPAHTEKIDDWLWEIDAHLDHGLNQSASHLALEAVKRAPREQRYKHKAVLATARSGSVLEALALFDQLGLDEDCEDEEIACLRPRLLRDLAFLTEKPRERKEYLQNSATAYDAAFRKCGGFYSGINAASGYAFLDDRDKSQTICAKVNTLLAEAGTDSQLNGDTDKYWHRVTLAEAQLLDGDQAKAASLFRAACTAEDVTSGKKATTRRQLIRLAPYMELEPGWIETAMPQAKPLFFSGPLASNSSAETEALIADALRTLDAFLAKTDVGWAYGALASGADIAIAEKLIEAGVSLNVHLPMAPEKFIKSSVYSSGENWVTRFENCMRAAAAVEWNHRIKAPGRAAYRLGAYAAMGKTIRHAQQLETNPLGFFAVQSGLEPSQSLSVANLETWRAKSLLHESVGGHWPLKSSASNRAEDASEIYFALVIEREDGKKAPKKLSSAGAGVITLADIDAEIILFGTPAKAAECATAFAKSAGASVARIWLDAGVLGKNEISKPTDAATEAFVTTACRPLTDRGKVFATESFTFCHTLLADWDGRFEYVGYVNAREKLDPCPMYSVAP